MSMVHCSSDSLPSKTKLYIFIFFWFSRKDLLRIYTNLNKLNEDLASSYQIRKQNFIEMQKSLDAVNSVLKSSIRLRMGSYAAKMMTLFKVAVKNKNVEAIVRIIETGENWTEDEALNTIHTIY